MRVLSLAFLPINLVVLLQDLYKRNKISQIPKVNFFFFFLLSFQCYVINTCLGLAPPRRTSNNVAHKFSVCGNLNNLSAIAEKIGCSLELICLWPSERDRVLPRLKNLGPFFSDGRSTKSLPRNCKPSNLIGSNSLLKQKTKEREKKAFRTKSLSNIHHINFK